MQSGSRSVFLIARGFMFLHTSSVEVRLECLLLVLLLLLQLLFCCCFRYDIHSLLQIKLFCCLFVGWLVCLLLLLLVVVGVVVCPCLFVNFLGSCIANSSCISFACLFIYVR